MKYKLEVIGFTIDGCRTAQSAGAHRIELCANPCEGGTTPSYAFIQLARQALAIELYPIIRPRGGDFLFNEDEFMIMLEDIRVVKKLGCDGIVTGILTAEGKVDKMKMRQVCALAYPLGVTFHRAYDRTINPLEALEDIIEMGCERILTSGQKPYALDGIDLIKKLIEKADERIIIMPGSGVNSNNIEEFVKTGATEFHTSARTKIKSRMDYINPSMIQDLETITVNEKEVISIIEKLGRISTN